jgi:catechol 2,3-dioxygenase-like lactoylglutathione lyase family enzyme
VSTYPKLMHTALDTTDTRRLADFYRQLLGLRYRPGEEPPSHGTPDDADWLVRTGAAGDQPDSLRQRTTTDFARPSPVGGVLAGGGGGRPALRSRVQGSAKSGDAEDGEWSAGV